MLPHLSSRCSQQQPILLQLLRRRNDTWLSGSAPSLYLVPSHHPRYPHPCSSASSTSPPALTPFPRASPPAKTRRQSVNNTCRAGWQVDEGLCRCRPKGSSHHRSSRLHSGHAAKGLRWVGCARIVRFDSRFIPSSCRPDGGRHSLSSAAVGSAAGHSRLPGRQKLSDRHHKIRREEVLEGGWQVGGWVDVWDGSIRAGEVRAMLPPHMHARTCRTTISQTTRQSCTGQVSPVRMLGRSSLATCREAGEAAGSACTSRHCVD